jgi:hypothetical protein
MAKQFSPFCHFALVDVASTGLLITYIHLF